MNHRILQLYNNTYEASLPDYLKVTFVLRIIDPLSISGGGFFNWITIIWIFMGWLVVMFISFTAFCCIKVLKGDNFEEGSDLGFWDMDLKDLNKLFNPNGKEDMFRKSVRFSSIK